MHWIFTHGDLSSNAGVTLGWKGALSCLLWHWVLQLCLKSCRFCLDWLLAGLQKETYCSSGVCSDGCCASTAGASGQEKGEMSETICLKKRDTFWGRLACTEFWAIHSSFLSLYIAKHNFIQLGEILLSPSFPLMQSWISTAGKLVFTMAMLAMLTVLSDS